ncbi:MAG: hypothetical protein JSW27_13660 [Phycisphaerales bacterium]|nr:MAG: hypothetical protein JSW27_13660 [Phycisphaerales bacterium]
MIESSLVLGATVAAVVGMIHLKDHVNRSEAMRAMTQLGRLILDHRQEHGSLPPQSFVDQAKGNLEGAVRMGRVRYRALWIGPDAPDETILAYSLKRHPSSLLKDGYVVLYLDGRVEWLPVASFEPLLAAQQSPAERRAAEK